LWLLRCVQLRLVTVTFCDVNVVWCYVLSQYPCYTFSHCTVLSVSCSKGLCVCRNHIPFLNIFGIGNSRNMSYMFLEAILQVVRKKLTFQDKKIKTLFAYWIETMLRIRDVYPGSRTLSFIHPRSWSPDPKTAAKRGVKKNLFSYLFFVATSHNITKLNIILIWAGEENTCNLGELTKHYRTFYPKNCHQALKNIGLGPEIRKNLFRIRGQKGTGSRIQIRNTELILSKLPTTFIHSAQKNTTAPLC
jgi:hypothetical protein